MLTQDRGLRNLFLPSQWWGKCIQTHLLGRAKIYFYILCVVQEHINTALQERTLKALCLLKLALSLHFPCKENRHVIDTLIFGHSCFAELLSALYTYAPILVRWGCCHKTPHTGRLRNNRHLFLTVLEAASPRSKNPQIQELVRAPSRVMGGCFLSVFSHGRREKGALWGLFCKSTYVIHGDSALMT